MMSEKEMQVRQCATALKEWATVLEAMGRGEQLLLIRKGGLIEPGSGFEVRSRSFVFYPTFEHQAVAYLRAPYQGYFEEAAKRRAPEGQVRMELFGMATASQTIHDPAVMARLAGFHIYNEAFVTQRLKWQPDQPLVAVIVRAYRLAAPYLCPVSPLYAGCKSWVDLDAAVPAAGAHPVLDDATFQMRAAAITSILGS